MQNVSKRATGLVSSEIIKLAGEVNQQIAQDKTIYNLTIGDFNSQVFPIPERLTKLIKQAYDEGQTNYPASNGILALREAVTNYLANGLKLEYSPNEVLIAGGGRPLIYACYQTLVEQGDHVIYPVPSWNNNHYTYLAGSNGIALETTAKNHFMPTAQEIAPHIGSAGLIALCSPLNPTGTAIGKTQMGEICQLVIEENERRKADNKKPVYVLFDQIYWALTYGETKHYHPVGEDERMKEYTIYIDGISKAFAATGVRVGWACGPQVVIDKMKMILGHIGAWSPKPEQWATAHFLQNKAEYTSFLEDFKRRIHERLDGLYAAFSELKAEGFNVDCIAPQAAMYLTAKFGILNKKTANGAVLNDAEDVANFLINEAGVAVVPFYAFGGKRDSAWFRISVGTIKTDDIVAIKNNLSRALNTLI